MTNSREPPNISILINKGYINENPNVFIYIPYANPRKQNPVSIGIVYGNAVFSAFSFIVIPLSPMFVLTTI